MFLKAITLLSISTNVASNLTFLGLEHESAELSYYWVYY